MANERAYSIDCQV